METITFYSYKGGTGRTLLVAHTARYLALSGKRVVAVDLDLEAPGLHYRLATAGGAQRGVVDYLVDSLNVRTAADPAVADYISEAAVPEGTSGRLWLMPAGPAPSGDYWKRLNQLFQLAPLLDASGAGLAALLDLKARIESDLAPEYLLLDARTGITEVGGVATSVLADKVVSLFVDNPESIEGTRAVIRSLRHVVRPAGSPSVTVFPVLSRVTEDLDKARKGALDDLNDGAADGEAFEELYVIRADPDVDVGSEASIGPPPKAPPEGAFRDYQFLLSALVPLDTTDVSPAWARHVAVQKLIEWLTADDEELGRRRFLRMNPRSFRSEQITEGIQISAGKPQYVDVAAFPDDNRTEPALVALYEQDFDGSTAYRQWGQGSSRVRCVVLFGLDKHSNLRRRVFTRSRYGSFTDRGDEWFVRWPVSFSLDDPGDHSTSSLLRAVQAGNQGFIPILVERWQHATWFGSHGGFTPDPREAKEIIDGLSALKGDSAAMVLWHTVADLADDRFELRHEGGSMREHTMRELHAPLWWRLSIEAKRDYQLAGRGRGGLPAAGLQLLASDVMGLTFDQEREFRERAPKGDKVRWRLAEVLAVFDFAVSDEPPPELVRRAALDPAYVDELPASRTGEKRDKALAAITARSTLDRLLQGNDGRLQVVTTNLLGGYDPGRARVTVYRPVVAWCANAIRVDERALENVVFLHETVHAICHLGLDLDGRRWDDFALPGSTFFDFRPSALHEGLAQYFTFRMLERLDDTGMWAAFERLTDVQPPEYQQWRGMREVPLERARTLLLEARAGFASSLREEA